MLCPAGGWPWPPAPSRAGTPPSLYEPRTCSLYLWPPPPQWRLGLYLRGGEHLSHPQGQPHPGPACLAAPEPAGPPLFLTDAFAL